MATLDLTNPVDQIRLRVGDTTDLHYLTDSAYSYALAESGNNKYKASVLAAQWILAQMAYSGHRKMANLEVWGKESFDSYRSFLLLLIRDPAIAQIAPVPYAGATSSTETNPLVQFTKDWNSNWVNGTQSDRLSETANSGVV